MWQDTHFMMVTLLLNLMRSLQIIDSDCIETGPDLEGFINSSRMEQSRITLAVKSPCTFLGLDFTRQC